MTKILEINSHNIDQEHICCAISDKKCKHGYEEKKNWLKQSFAEGYKFLRLNERAKVFLEYGPAEEAWSPIHAPNYFNLNCFWVSGRYKKQGYAKELLQMAIKQAKQEGKLGLIAVVGHKKMHFMSDGKWFLKQGFNVVDSSPLGFDLLALSFQQTDKNPSFVVSQEFSSQIIPDGVTVFYSNLCPFAPYHVNVSLLETVKKRNIPYHIVHLDSKEKAQNAPSPATIFSLFYNGQFVTTDISACMDSRFDRIVLKNKHESN